MSLPQALLVVPLLLVLVLVTPLVVLVVMP